MNKYTFSFVCMFLIIASFAIAQTPTVINRPFIVSNSFEVTGPTTLNGSILVTNGTLTVTNLIVNGNVNVTNGTLSVTNLVLNGNPISTLAAPVGSVTAYAGTVAPTDWMECNGASLLRSAYPALFAVISTNHGTADVSHFNVPDLRGNFVRGWSHGSGTDPDRATRTAPTGGNSGDNVGSIQLSASKTHDHTSSMTITATNAFATNTTISLSITSTNAAHSHTGTIDDNTDPSTAYKLGGGWAKLNTGFGSSSAYGASSSSVMTHNHTITIGAATSTHTHNNSTGTIAARSGSHNHITSAVVNNYVDSTESRPANISLMYIIKCQ